MESFDFKGFKTTKKGFLIAKDHYLNGGGLYQDTWDELQQEKNLKGSYKNSVEWLSGVWALVDDPSKAETDPHLGKHQLLGMIANSPEALFERAKCKDGLEAYEYLIDVLKNEIYSSKYTRVRFAHPKKVVNALNMVTDYICILYKEWFEK